MQSEVPQLGVLPFLGLGIITGLILIIPVWKIFKKTKNQKTGWSLLVFFPFPIGLWIVCAILAFSFWPATEFKEIEKD